MDGAVEGNAYGDGDSATAVWASAMETYCHGFSAAQRAQLEEVTGIGRLLEQVTYLRKRYASRRSTRCFNRLASILEWVDGFGRCVRSFLNAGAPQFVLIWGSLSFLLEVITRLTHLLMCDLVLFYLALPTPHPMAELAGITRTLSKNHTDCRPI